MDTNNLRLHRWFLSNGVNLLSILIYAGMVALLPSISTFPDDTGCWGRWSAYGFTNGLSQIYGSDTNYLPLYHYVLWLYGQLAGSVAAIDHNLHYLRSATLLFDFWGLWMIWRWTGERINYNLLLLISMLNVGYSYDTLVWGQVDGIEAALAFAAIYCAARGRLLWSGVCYVLALNMKLQAIVFFPVWLLIILPACRRPGGWKSAAAAFGAMLAVLLLLLWPFAYGPGGWNAVWKVVTGSVGQVPRLSPSAFNIWYWLTSEYPADVSDSGLFHGLSYRYWGLLMFMAGSAIALIPVARIVYGKCCRRIDSYDKSEVGKILLAAALCCLLFFYCNTQMHERYSVPAMIFVTAYAFLKRKYGLYLLCSLVLFLNMESYLHAFGFADYSTFLFQGRFVSVLFAALILGLFVQLFKISLLKETRPPRIRSGRFNLRSKFLIPFTAASALRPPGGYCV